MLDETSTEAPVEPQLSGVEPLPTSPEEPLMEKKIMDKMDKIRKMQSKVPIFKRLLPKAPEPQEQEVGQSAPEKSSGESSQSFPSMINTSQDQEKEKIQKSRRKILLVQKITFILMKNCWQMSDDQEEKNDKI